MSLIMRPKKTSAAYTAAVLQALQESQHAVGNFLGESGTVEYMEHLLLLYPDHYCFPNQPILRMC